MTRPFVLGLTGSIGMGKTTAAAMFAAEGVPVWDADAAVHALYGPGGDAVAPLAALVPEAVGPRGVDRGALKAAIAAEPSLIVAIERIVHPLVARDRGAFIDRAARHGARVVVLDTPLLFESGYADIMDAVAVVSAPEADQRRRVLARPGMTPEQFAFILSRQVPDAEKRARADFVIPTATMDEARAAVRAVLATIRSRQDA